MSLAVDLKLHDSGSSQHVFQGPIQLTWSWWGGGGGGGLIRRKVDFNQRVVRQWLKFRRYVQ